MMAKCGKVCEVFQRIVGYYRPIRNWNKGKQEEHKGRQEFAAPQVAAMPKVNQPKRKDK